MIFCLSHFSLQSTKYCNCTPPHFAFFWHLQKLYGTYHILSFCPYPMFLGSNPYLKFGRPYIIKVINHHIVVSLKPFPSSSSLFFPINKYLLRGTTYSAITTNTIVHNKSLNPIKNNYHYHTRNHVPNHCHPSSFSPSS